MNLNLVPPVLSPDEIFVLRFDYALIWKWDLTKYLTEYGTNLRAGLGAGGGGWLAVFMF